MRVPFSLLFFLFILTAFLTTTFFSAYSSSHIMPPKSKLPKTNSNVAVVVRGINRLRQPLWVMPDPCKNCAGHGEKCIRRGLAGSCEQCHGRKVACNLRKYIFMLWLLVIVYLANNCIPLSNYEQCLRLGAVCN